jgi:hypothetical protein
LETSNFHGDPIRYAESQYEVISASVVKKRDAAYQKAVRDMTSAGTKGGETRYLSTCCTRQRVRNLADSMRKQGPVLAVMFRKCLLSTSQRRDYSGTSWCRSKHPPCCVGSCARLTQWRIGLSGFQGGSEIHSVCLHPTVNFGGRHDEGISAHSARRRHHLPIIWVRRE